MGGALDGGATTIFVIAVTEWEQWQERGQRSVPHTHTHSHTLLQTHIHLHLFSKHSTHLEWEKKKAFLQLPLSGLTFGYTTRLLTLGSHIMNTLIADNLPFIWLPKNNNTHFF